MTLTEKLGEDPSMESSDAFARIFIFLVPACIGQVPDHHEIENGLWPGFAIKIASFLFCPFWTTDQESVDLERGREGVWWGDGRYVLWRRLQLIQDLV